MGWQAFGSLAAGNQPLSLFDTLTGQISQTVINPTTAAGTNAITLTLNANAGPVTAYQNFMQFSFVASATSTGPVTIQVGSLATVNLYKPGNVAAGTGDITSGVLYVIAFNQALNVGSGGFVIVSATPASLSLPVTVPNGGTGLTSLTPFAVLCGGTGATSNVQQVSGLGTATQVLTSQGAGALPQWANPASGGTGLVSIQVFSTSQTVTIPAGATKAAVRLVGGGGGVNTGSTVNCAGSAAALFKYLSGLTAGNTLILTVGAAGTNTAVANTDGGTGGSTILASGTQTITTLTAAGGNPSGSGPHQINTGGTATNGDLNYTGQLGKIFAFNQTSSGCPPTNTALFAANVARAEFGGTSFGSGGANSPPALTNSGLGTLVSANQGYASIEWFG